MIRLKLWWLAPHSLEVDKDTDSSYVLGLRYSIAHPVRRLIFYLTVIVVCSGSSSSWSEVNAWNVSDGEPRSLRVLFEATLSSAIDGDEGANWVEGAAADLIRVGRTAAIFSTCCCPPLTQPHHRWPIAFWCERHLRPSANGVRLVVVGLDEVPRLVANSGVGLARRLGKGVPKSPPRSVVDVSRTL